MGRGDSRTRRGKIFKASYGNTRKHATKKVTKRTTVAAPTPAKKTPATKKAK